MFDMRSHVTHEYTRDVFLDFHANVETRCFDM